MRTEAKIIHDVADNLPNTTRDVLVWFEGNARPGVGHYDPEAKAWRVVTRPKGTEGTWPTAWADYPLPDTRPTEEGGTMSNTSKANPVSNSEKRFALARKYASLHKEREAAKHLMGKVEEEFLETEGPLLIVVDGVLVDFSEDEPQVYSVDVAVD